MEQAHPPAPKAVHADKHRSRLDDSAHFAEQPILQPSGRNVMKHGEGNGSRKGFVLKRKRRSVALYHSDVCAAEALTQRMGQATINFKDRELLEPPAQPARREPKTRPNLDHMVAEIETIEHPRQNLPFEPPFPGS